MRNVEFEYRVEAAPYNGETEQQVRVAASQAFPGYVVEGVARDNDEWSIRLAKPLARRVAEFPFQKKDEEDAPSDPADDTSTEDKPEETDEGSSDEKKDEGDDNQSDSTEEFKQKDPVAQIKELLSELQIVFQSLKEKADKVDEIHDSIKDHVADEDVPVLDGPPVPGGPGDVGPVPGIPRGPRPPMPAGRTPGKKQPPIPPRGLPTAFTKVWAPKVANGKPVSLVEALAELEKDPEFKGYRVHAITDEGDEWRADLTPVE